MTKVYVSLGLLYFFFVVQRESEQFCSAYYIIYSMRKIEK